MRMRSISNQFSNKFYMIDFEARLYDGFFLFDTQEVHNKILVS